MEGNAKTYLGHLADEFRRRDWLATRLVGDRLQVTNPDAAGLTEVICCRQDAGTWLFYWTWNDPIGPANAVAASADRITHVLRGIDADGGVSP
jgi:hypothetical protein